jgi:hypothetical protein
MKLVKMNEAQTAKLFQEFPQSDYFAEPRLNSSSFSQLLKSIDSYIASRQKVYDENDSFRVGSALHSLLEGTFDKNYVIDNFDGRKKEDKERKALLLAEGKSFVKPQEMEMFKAWERNAKLMPLLDRTVWDFVLEQSSIKEAVILFEEDGIQCKAMVDNLLPEHGIFIDYKTTRTCASVRELEQSVYKYFYFVQAAFYQKAIKHLYGQDFQPYYIFFEKEEPYGIRIFTFSQDYLDYANTIIEQGKFLYKEYIRNKSQYDSKQLYGGYEVAPIVGKKPYWINNKETTDEF